MKDSMKNHDVSRWFISEPDSTEGILWCVEHAGVTLFFINPTPRCPNGFWEPVMSARLGIFSTVTWSVLR